MRLSHDPVKISASFDDPNLVSCAGLVPVMGLAERAGLAHHGRGQLTLHLPAGWHCEHDWVDLSPRRLRPAAHTRRLTSPDRVTPAPPRPMPPPHSPGQNKDKPQEPSAARRPRPPLPGRGRHASRNSGKRSLKVRRWIEA